jgi:hypothetical protein
MCIDAGLPEGWGHIYNSHEATSWLLLGFDFGLTPR